MTSKKKFIYRTTKILKERYNTYFKAKGLKENDML